MSIYTYVINLDKRTDRWKECIRNFTENGAPIDQFHRWSACEDATFGALGCARSHLLALADFIGNRTESHCLIFEDDFDFLYPWSIFIEKINRLVQSNIEWDVLMLAGTYTVAYTENSIGLSRVVESNSASGYLLTRQYANKLLACFANSVIQLQKIKEYNSRSFWVSRFAIDVMWKQLQFTDRWLIFTPVIGHQRPSFSDIEGRIVDYSSVSHKRNETVL